MISALTTIRSLDLPALQPYRTLRRPLEHRQEGFFIAEGEKVVRRLLESRLKVLSVLMTPEWLEKYRDRMEERSEEIGVYLGAKELLESIVGFRLHAGIMAKALVPVPPLPLELVAASPRPRFIVAIDRLVSAENVGVVVRNCAAAGVHGLVVGETSADPYLRRAVRNSMGTVFGLPVAYSADLSGDLGAFRTTSGLTVYAAHPRETSRPVYAADLTADICIVFGNEGEGIGQQILARCDAAITVPMSPGVDSLNVASASAAILYEVVRQRAAR